MLAHCNLKQNMSLCSKQSGLFSFSALPSGGKLKDVVVHWANGFGHSNDADQKYFSIRFCPVAVKLLLRDSTYTFA